METLLEALFPSLLLQKSGLYEEWKNSQGERTYKTVLIFSLIGVVGYSAILMFVHPFLPIEVIEEFKILRISQISSFLLVYLFLLYFQHKVRNKSTTASLAFYVLNIAVTVGQFFTTKYYPPVTILYNGILPTLIFILSREGMGVSIILFSTLFFGCNYFIFNLQEQNIKSFYSLITLSIVTIIIYKYGLIREIKDFIKIKLLVSEVEKKIKLEMELKQEISAFLPKVIYQRFQDAMQKQKLTILQAFDHVLMRRDKNITCIFTDVRGFTQFVKNSTHQSRHQYFDHIRRTTQTMEDYNGIPRMIGDLVFGYFDDDAVKNNIINTLRACATIYLDDQEIETISNRYFIVTYGDCIVGNIGGIDSSREITAIGNAVNLASRIDTLTKEKALAQAIGHNHIIMSEKFFMEMENVFSNKNPFQTQKIDIHSLNLKIRDFPEEQYVYLFLVIEDNFKFLNLTKE
jgi:class 3 adenylate cyclase